MSWHVTMMTPQEAERFERRIFNVGDDEALGWKPYTILVTKDAMSVTAFCELREFKRWLATAQLAVDRVTHRGRCMRGFSLKGAAPSALKRGVR